VTDSGLTRMGVRLYNPATAPFSSVDPVVGGNPGPREFSSMPLCDLVQTLVSAQ
jgi:hypothetical protein